MSDIPNEHEADEVKLRTALNRWKLDDPPPDPPVEAMWEEIRRGLPLVDAQAHSGASSNPAGGGVARRRTPRRGVPSMAKLTVWVPALMAAGLAGMMFGRWTAPDVSTSGSDGAPPSGVEAPGIARGGEPAEGPVSIEDGTSGEVAGARPESGSVGGTPLPEDAGATDPPAMEAPRPPSDAPRFAADPSSGREADEVGGVGGNEEPTGPRPDFGLPSYAVAGGESAIRFATTRHLLEVGPMLTRLAGGADPEAGTVPSEIRNWADRLLAETRFLLDDPEPVDPGLLALLEDLEMLLAQVVTLPPPSSETARVELELIAEGMSERRILPRIHTFAYGGTDQ